MRKLRTLLSIVLCIALLSGYTPDNASAAQTSTCVALGDSIITGYGLVNFNPNDKSNIASPNNFVNKLSKKLNQKAVNLGVEGLDSSGLLKNLSSSTTASQKTAISQIKGAGIIVISIGGNNVFIPILNAVNDKVSKLFEGKSIYNANSQELQLALLSLIFDKTAMTNMQNAVTASAAKFIGEAKSKKAGDIANIISTVKKYNPKAKIVMLTIYNPYTAFLPKAFNDAIISMNTAIIKGSANGKNYLVADVYSAFSKAGSDKVLVNSTSGNSFDPHPTAEGHELIYALTAYAAQNNVLPYQIKSIITKGSLSARISEGELILKITPNKGYIAPKNVSITIGKGPKKVLKMVNGVASIPIAELDNSSVITAACVK